MRVRSQACAASQRLRSMQVFHVRLLLIPQQYGDVLTQDALQEHDEEDGQQHPEEDGAVENERGG